MATTPEPLSALALYTTYRAADEVLILDTSDTTMGTTGTDKRIQFSTLLSMAGVTSGTVTSVSWTGDGTIFTASADTPVTTSGTLTPSLATQTKNTLLAGPTTGSDAAPTFRALAASDLPSGTGTVTSVSWTGDGTIFTASADTPVTTSGTLTPSLATQTKNTLLAGPTTGSNAAPTFRALATSDLPSGTGTVTSVSFTGDGTIFTASADTPVTTSGTLTPASLIAQTKNTLLAGPTTGSNAAPTFRALTAADVPSLPASQITSGQLAVAQGGTGQATATAAFNALSPMTTAGDLIDGGTSGAAQRLGIGTTGQVLTVASGAPAWANPVTESSVNAVLGSQYTCTTSMANAGVSITLPVAGTYLLTGNIRAALSITGSTVGGSAWISTQFYDQTNSNVVTNSNSLNLLGFITVSGVASTPQSCGPIGPVPYTVTGSTVIQLRAQYTPSAVTVTSANIPSDSNGYTSISAIRIY